MFKSILQAAAQVLTLFICFLRPGRNAILAAYTQLWNKSWYFSWNVKEQESGTNFCLHHPFVFCLSVLPVATLCTDKRYKDLFCCKVNLKMKMQPQFLSNTTIHKYSRYDQALKGKINLAVTDVQERKLAAQLSGITHHHHVLASWQQNSTQHFDITEIQLDPSPSSPFILCRVTPVSLACFSKTSQCVIRHKLCDHTQEWQLHWSHGGEITRQTCGRWWDGGQSWWCQKIRGHSWRSPLPPTTTHTLQASHALKWKQASTALLWAGFVL